MLGPISETHRRKGIAPMKHLCVQCQQRQFRETLAEEGVFPLPGLREGPWDPENAAGPSPGRRNTTCP